MIELTLFRNLYDNKTDKRLELSDFSEFESLLYKLSSERREGKHDSHLMSPACYTEGTNRRCNANVSHWSAWAAMDVDDHSFSSENLENELRNRFADYQFVCYSTASSAWDHPKFRMVFPLTEQVAAEKIRHFWFVFNRELGDIGDSA